MAGQRRAVRGRPGHGVAGTFKIEGAGEPQPLAGREPLPVRGHAGETVVSLQERRIQPVIGTEQAVGADCGPVFHLHQVQLGGVDQPVVPVDDGLAAIGPDDDVAPRIVVVDQAGPGQGRRRGIQGFQPGRGGGAQSRQRLIPFVGQRRGKSPAPGQRRAADAENILIAGLKGDAVQARQIPAGGEVGVPGLMRPKNLAVDPFVDEERPGQGRH